jgi:hypothetical protein
VKVNIFAKRGPGRDLRVIAYAALLASAWLASRYGEAPPLSAEELKALDSPSLVAMLINCFMPLAAIFAARELSRPKRAGDIAATLGIAGTRALFRLSAILASAYAFVSLIAVLASLVALALSKDGIFAAALLLNLATLEAWVRAKRLSQAVGRGLRIKFKEPRELYPR